jgi:transposase
MPGRKFTREEKIEMINEYNEKNKSINTISEKYNISKSYMKHLLKQQEKGGIENIGMGQRNKEKRQYEGKFKLKVVKERIASGAGYRETARKYEINHAVIQVWERKYLEEGEEGLVKDKRSMGLNVKESRAGAYQRKKDGKKVEKDVISEIQELRMENEYLKKLNALIQDGRKTLVSKKHR